MSESHSLMYLKLTDQNLMFCKLSLSLSHAPSFSPSCKCNVFLVWARSCYHWLYWKECYCIGGNRSRDLIADSIPTKAALFFCSDLSWNTYMYICYGHTLLPLLQDWQLQVSGRRMFSVMVNGLCISMPMLLSVLAWFIKNAVPHSIYVKKLQLQYKYRDDCIVHAPR